MKKGLRYLVLALVVSCANVLVSIAQPTLDYIRGIGGAANDYGASIAAVESGGTNLVFTTGVFRGTAINFNPGGTARNLTSSGGVNADLYIGKYDVNGVLAATSDVFRVGTISDLDLAERIYIDASSNVYVIGTCVGNSFFNKNTISGTLAGGTNGRGFVVKYDKDLVLQWGFVIGETAGAALEVKDITVDNTGNVYITGRFQNTVEFNPGPTATGASGGDPGPFPSMTLTSNGGFDMYVAKYNSGGRCLWAINSGGTGNDQGNAIGTDGTNVFASGIFRGQNVDFDPSAAVFNLSENGGGSVSGDIFVSKYASSTGAFSNAFSLGNALFEGVTGMAVSNSGELAISGYFAKDALAVDFDPGPGSADAFAAGTSGTDLFIAKYNSNLDYVWHRTVGSPGNERANYLKLSGSNLYVTGSFEGTGTDFGNSNAISSAGGLDAFLAGYSFSSGNCLFALPIGGTADEEGLGVGYANSKLYVTGSKRGDLSYTIGANPPATLTNNGGQDIFFAQYNYAACILPSITTQPASAASCVGTSASFTVVASNATSYQWKKGAANASGTSTNATYTIPSVVTGDAGNYTVEVTNACGTVTSTPAAVLTINDVPAITAQPVSITRCVGTAANFSVTASNATSYQWKKGAANASGTSTNTTYAIASVVAGDAGNYTVEVTNSCGTATSTPAAVLTINDVPAITAQPVSITRCVGTAANFSVTASNAVSYQWKKGAANASGTSTNATYTIASVVTGDAGNYTVEVTNSCGTVTSTPAAVLTISDVPSITAQPVSITRCVGTAANFSVTATNATSYQWKKGAANASGTSTNATYTIASVVTGDAGNYTVEVTNSCGTVTSTPAAVLTINDVPAITAQPVSITRCVGTAANFSVTASNATSYQWKKGAANASGTSTNTTYAIASVVAGDAGNYTVEVTNSCGTVTSTPAAVLTINDVPAITAQPVSITRCVGTAANFSVTASNATSYQWKKGAANASGTSTNSAYAIASVVTGDAGNYTVEVTNSCGTVTSTPAAVLTISDVPSITAQPVSITRCVGTAANFSVTASNATSYQWKKGTANASGTSTNSAYAIASVVTGDAGNYTVEVTNSCGTVTSTPAAVLTISDVPSITAQPVSITRCVGTAANFSVTATNATSYQWKKGTANASGTSTNAAYAIASVITSDAGNYTVEVTNSCGTVTSTPAAVLTINDVPAITAQPVSITRCVGTAANFSVTASNATSYQWKKGTANASGTSTNAAYAIASVITSDAGNYTVEVTNSCGTVTSTPAAVLTINDVPAITAQPASISRCVGSGATFSVTASNAISYQWKKGAANASGTSTNATYTIASVVTGDAGNYTVEVTNSCGTVTSSPVAVLTVNSPITSNAGTTQGLCNVTVATLAGNNPSPGTGAWTVTSGSGAVTTPTSATSGVTGLTIGGVSVFTWTITNGACVTSSNVTINVSSPATANAGADQTLCNVTSTNMNATGTGTWTTFSGSGVAQTPSSPTSAVNGLTVGASTTMRWTVNNGACSAYSDVLITVSAPGSANAGTDQVICNTTTTTMAAAGSGTWTKISGTGAVTTPNSATSGVTGLTVGATSVFEWTVTAGACSGTAQVNITVSAPATGSAGANQSLCGETAATLSATGTGSWTKTSGTGTVTNPTNPNSGVTGLTVGASSVFQWTVTNGACSTSTTTTIASNAPVSITTEPAASITLCTGNTFNLNVVATGSGTLTYQWKKGTSNANGASTGSSYSIGSVVFGDAGNYTVEVSNSCGTETSNVAVLAIQNLAITTQPQSQTVCPGAAVTFSVAATGPSIAYQWKKDNVDLLGETASSLVFNSVSSADEANYTVLVSGCSNSILSDPAALALSVCTGIEDGNINHHFRVYPNPVMTTLHLSGFAQDPIRSLMIVDVNGEVVFQEKEMNAASYQLSVASFSQGLYHVILFTASGNKWIEKVEVAK